ncbi:hypothetical protein K438DRAFT_1987126 [Mycena galopus ATCC 62051]|nr:hypothetical protein K438DRAFT_1987126 [Mycena galopus ATCC 62051]
MRSGCASFAPRAKSNRFSAKPQSSLAPTTPPLPAPRPLDLSIPLPPHFSPGFNGAAARYPVYCCREQFSDVAHVEHRLILASLAGVRAWTSCGRGRGTQMQDGGKTLAHSGRKHPTRARLPVMFGIDHSQASSSGVLRDHVRWSHRVAIQAALFCERRYHTQVYMGRGKEWIFTSRLAS